MPDISTTFMGLHFGTPFILASGQATTSVGEIHKHCEKIAENGWAGLATKSIINSYGPKKRPHLWSSSGYKNMAMVNSGPAMSIYSKEMLQMLKRDIDSAHDNGLIIIPNIISGSLEEWKTYARNIEDLGADALELNLSCPSPFGYITQSMGGCHIGQNPDVTRQVVEAVTDAVDIPVMPKLTFHSPDIAQVARACRDAGGRSVSAINTIKGILGIDLDTGKILSEGFNRKTYLGNLSGPMIRPFGLRAVAEIKREVEDIEVCAVGGIDGWQSAVEYMMVGATLTQVCTAVMWKGFSLGKKLKKGLIQFMEQKGYSKLSDFRGIALKDICSPEGSQGRMAYPVMDGEKCTMCGRCVKACKDAAYDALRIDIDESRLTVQEERCESCGLCKIVCPEDAVSYAVGEFV